MVSWMTFGNRIGEALEVTTMGDSFTHFVTPSSTSVAYSWGRSTEVEGTGYARTYVYPATYSAAYTEPEKEKLMALGARTFPNISKEEAATQLALYESLPELTEHEKILMAVYDAIVAETSFVDLSVLFQADQRWTPKLGIAPISATEVTFTRIIHEPTRSDRRHAEKRHERPRSTWSSSFRAGSWSLDHSGVVSPSLGAAIDLELHTKVPSVIPTERDKVQDGDLIIWDANWKETYRRELIQERPDPMVIRHITGDIYKVVAAWDLTPIEAALLAQ